MTIKDIEYEMRANGVYQEDIKIILENSKKYKMNPQYIDNELVKLGYDKIFTIDYDDIKSDDEYDECVNYQKIYHKKIVNFDILAPKSFNTGNNKLCCNGTYDKPHYSREYFHAIGRTE